jgi:hypothetical protein
MADILPRPQDQHFHLEWKFVELNPLTKVAEELRARHPNGQS